MISVENDIQCIEDCKEDETKVKSNFVIKTETNTNELLGEHSLCMIAIFSGGLVFRGAIQTLFKNEMRDDIFSGFINLYQENDESSQPLFNERDFPPNIQHQKVFIMDAFVSTGNRARMAIQVLLDHHCQCLNICFLCLIAKEEGVQYLIDMFPNVTFVIGFMVDGSFEMPSSKSLILRFCKAADIDIIVEEEEDLLSYDDALPSSNSELETQV